MRYFLLFLLFSASVWGQNPDSIAAYLGKSQARQAQQVKSLHLNLNTASAAQLQQIPGVGPTLAARIALARRGRPFTSVYQLLHVSGIGQVKFQAIFPHVYLPAPPPPPPPPAPLAPTLSPAQVSAGFLPPPCR